jgi:fructose-1,6-bisphosphatase/inositol monophosphatase family enzyme
VLCLADADGALAGVVYDPVRDELFVPSGEGRMALAQCVALGVSCTPPPVDDLASALVATGFAYVEGRPAGAGTHPARGFS